MHNMHNKKTFTSPRVLQTLDVALENDLLAGPSSMDQVLATGQEKKDADITGSYWE